MRTTERRRLAIQAAINSKWEEWRAAKRGQEGDSYQGYPGWRYYEEWSGCRSVSRVTGWLRHGPETTDLERAEFRNFCKKIGVDLDRILAEPTADRCLVFRLRLKERLGLYKQRTGKGMKGLAEALSFTAAEYQWLRRLASQGADHVRGAKQSLLKRVAFELGTTTDYLFGRDETEELPTWDAIIALGVAEFSKRQPEGSKFSTVTAVFEHLATVSLYSLRHYEAEARTENPNFLKRKPRQNPDNSETAIKDSNGEAVKVPTIKAEGN